MSNHGSVSVSSHLKDLLSMKLFKKTWHSIYLSQNFASNCLNATLSISTSPNSHSVYSGLVRAPLAFWASWTKTDTSFCPWVDWLIALFSSTSSVLLWAVDPQFSHSGSSSMLLSTKTLYLLGASTWSPLLPSTHSPVSPVFSLLPFPWPVAYTQTDHSHSFS